MGCLLGQQSGRTVDISNSFEIKFEQGPGGIAINDAFLQKKMEQCECGRALAAGCRRGGVGCWAGRRGMVGGGLKRLSVELLLPGARFNLGFYKAGALLATLETSARLHAPGTPHTED